MRLPPPKRKPNALERLLSKPVFSEIPITIVQHCEAVPLGVMVRGTMEWLLAEPTMEKLFAEHAPDQCTRELTISALVVVVFSLFLLHDVSRIVTGGETNYIMAATGVYISLYNVFVNLLSLLMAFTGQRD